jgi:hypothetical protein
LLFPSLRFCISLPFLGYDDLSTIGRPTAAVVRLGVFTS